MDKEILLRSSWQDVNIGDISHTPAMLAILEKQLPEVKVTVWASSYITNNVIDMIQKRFQGVGFIKGNADNADVREAIMRADFLLHGSGPFLVGAHEIKQYIELTGKKFGASGITYRRADKEMLNKSEFVYFRDSVSLENAKNDGVKAKYLDFGPDAAFAFDLEAENKAEKFLSDNKLEYKKFVCCIPRLRITPYWKMRSDAPYNRESDEINNRFKEQDHKYLRAAIIRVLENTDVKVLVCPEDQTQMLVGKEMIIDKLPKKYHEKVVLRSDYWLTDEAVSVYRKSLALFGNEMHSPIMCIGNNIPAVVCRWEQQTSKGFMWNDIGLGEWLFDSDVGINDDDFADTIMDVVINNDKAVNKTKQALDIVNRNFVNMASRIRSALNM